MEGERVRHEELLARSRMDVEAEKENTRLQKEQFDRMKLQVRRGRRRDITYY